MEFLSICQIGCCPIHESFNKANLSFKFTPLNFCCRTGGTPCLRHHTYVAELEKAQIEGQIDLIPNIVFFTCQIRIIPQRTVGRIKYIKCPVELSTGPSENINSLLLTKKKVSFLLLILLISKIPKEIYELSTSRGLFPPARLV